MHIIPLLHSQIQTKVVLAPRTGEAQTWVGEGWLEAGKAFGEDKDDLTAPHLQAPFHKQRNTSGQILLFSLILTWTQSNETLRVRDMPSSGGKGGSQDEKIHSLLLPLFLFSLYVSTCIIQVLKHLWRTYEGGCVRVKHPRFRCPGLKSQPSL